MMILSESGVACACTYKVHQSTNENLTMPRPALGTYSSEMFLASSATCHNRTASYANTAYKCAFLRFAKFVLLQNIAFLNLCPVAE